MKKIRIIIFLFPCIFIINCNTSSDDKKNTNPTLEIAYNTQTLMVHTPVLFSCKEPKDSLEYKWSYKKSTDTDYYTTDLISPIAYFYFIEPDTYKIKVEVNSGEFGEVEITIGDRVMANTDYSVFYTFTPAGSGNYTMKISFSDAANSYLDLITDNTQQHVEFNLGFWDIKTSGVDRLYFYNLPALGIAQTIDSLNGVLATNITNPVIVDTIPLSELKSYYLMDFQLLYKDAGGEAYVKYAAGRFAPVICNEPDEFNIYF